MTIILCKANGSQAELPAIREAYRAAGLEINDITMRQLAVPREPDFHPVTSRDTWGRLIDQAMEIADNGDMAFADIEYPNYSLRPATELQLSVREALHSTMRVRGIPVSGWGYPWVQRATGPHWTSGNAVGVIDQMDHLLDFYLPTMALVRPIETVADHHFHVRLAGKVASSLLARGKPVVMSWQTWRRPAGTNARVLLTADEAYAIGLAMRTAHEAGAMVMLWTEEQGPRGNQDYQYQLDEVARVGPWIADGWRSWDLGVQGDAGGPQGVE